MTNDSSKLAPEVATLAAADGAIARRRLLRAGLAAAPVLAGLKSQSALATGSGVNHMTCSVWASVSAAKGCRNSHVAQHVGNTCKSYLVWKDVDNSYCNTKFHKTSGVFDDSCYKSWATVRDVCRGSFSNGNSIVASNQYIDSKKSEFSKHCAAMYVNANTDTTCPIKATEIQKIWSDCKNGGYSAPPRIAGAGGWSRDEWNDYFGYICKGTKPSTWGSTCA
jgi:hypothetical protein